MNDLHLKISATEMNITTADGHRLSQYSLKETFNMTGVIEIIIPKDMIKWIASIPNGEVIQLSTDNNLFQIIWSSGQVISNLIDGEFPDVAPLFMTPANKQFEVNKYQFLEGLKRLKATNIIGDERCLCITHRS